MLLLGSQSTSGFSKIVLWKQMADITETWATKQDLSLTM